MLSPLETKIAFATHVSSYRNQCFFHLRFSLLLFPIFRCFNTSSSSKSPYFKVADDTKIGNSIITEHDRMGLQEDLRKIWEWPQRWEMPFNVIKCHILQVGTRIRKFDYEMNGTKLESVQCVKDLGVTIASGLKFSQQCKDAAGKANRMLDFTNRNFSFKIKDVILPLYINLDHIWNTPCNLGRLTMQRLQQK